MGKAARVLGLGALYLLATFFVLKGALGALGSADYLRYMLIDGTRVDMWTVLSAITVPARSWRWPGQAGAAPMTETPKPVVTIDCQGLATPAAFWQAYIDAARPAHAEHFGSNLDALWDALEGGGPGWPGDVRLVFANVSALEPFTTAGGDSFLEAFRGLVADVTQIEVELT